MVLHPLLISQNGVKEFVVLPYNEYLYLYTIANEVQKANDVNSDLHQVPLLDNSECKSENRSTIL